MPTKVNPRDIPIAIGSSAGLEGAFDQANNAQVEEARNRYPAAFRDLLIPNDPGVAKVAIFKQEMSEGEDEPVIGGPLIEGPVHVDNGFRINVSNFANMLGNCIIIYTPFSDVRFGEHSWINPGLTIIAAERSQSVNDKNGKPLTVGRKVTIGGCSWIGNDVVILPGVEIGHHSKVGHGSVVTESVPPYHYVKGNPAVVVKRFDKNIASGTEDIHFSDQLAEWGVKR
ncbi:Hypothetical protein NCS54_00362400 [Fusarium falciforme]|uniref:Hypothetical protein n=1 Tax=Fusarium falciforme TaxID=195108 RepID=UPI00230096DB|nr:Hypothetical protein NCS54_00362400 [Fusarium falciforme]WAO86352.1 Hypothetical protein NCS54_00362400 [Fusarium falciforme]